MTNNKALTKVMTPLALSVIVSTTLNANVTAENLLEQDNSASQTTATYSKNNIVTKQAVDDAKKILDEATNQTYNKQKEVNIAKKNVETITQEISKKEAFIASVKNYPNKQVELEKTIKDEQDKLQKVMAEKSELEKSHILKADELKLQKTKVLSIKKTIESLKKAVESAKELLQQHTMKEASLIEALQQAKDELETAIQEQKSFKEELEDEKNAEVNTQNQIKTAKLTLENLNTNKIKIQQKIDALKKQIADTNEDKLALKTQLTSAEEQYKDIESRIKQLSHNLKVLQSVQHDYSYLEEELAKLTQTIENAQKVVDEKQKSFDAYVAEKNQLEETLAQKNTTLSKKQSELKTEQEKYNGLDKTIKDIISMSLSSKVIEVKHLTENIHKLEEQLKVISASNQYIKEAKEKLEKAQVIFKQLEKEQQQQKELQKKAAKNYTTLLAAYQIQEQLSQEKNEKYDAKEEFVKQHNNDTLNYTGLVNNNGQWQFVRHDKIDTNYTGLVSYNNQWYYVQKGLLHWGVNAVATKENDHTLYYISNATLDMSYTGLAQHANDTWYYVKNGVVDYTYSGLVMYQGTWYNVINGVLDWHFTGVVQYDNNWYYVQNGQLHWGVNGLVSPMKNGQTDTSSLYYVENSTVANYTGLMQHTDGTWLYVKQGKFDQSYSGLVLYHGTWYNVNNGVLDWHYTSLVQYNGAWYYVQNGQLNWGKTTLARDVKAGPNSLLYYVTNSTFDTSYTGLAQAEDGTWYYVINGVESKAFTGIVSYHGKQFYVQNGQIDWNFSGAVTINGRNYTIQSAQVTVTR